MAVAAESENKTVSAGHPNMRKPYQRLHRLMEDLAASQRTLNIYLRKYT